MINLRSSILASTCMIALLNFYMVTNCGSVMAAETSTILPQIASSVDTIGIVIVKKLFKYDTSNKIEKARHIEESVGGYSERIFGILATKYQRVGSALVYKGIQRSGFGIKEKGLLVLEYTEYPGKMYGEFGIGDSQGWRITCELKYFRPDTSKPQWKHTLTATNSPTVSTMLGLYGDAMENMVEEFSKLKISTGK